MQYLLLIYSDEKIGASMSKAEMGTVHGEYMAFLKDFAGAIRGSNGLQPTGTAKTVRVRDGKSLITDGPFAETKEQLGGYFLVGAGSQDEALAIAAKIPSARFGGVEVRPIWVMA
ncbi:MAG: YciI family protein [Bryobacteraceae bacterium]|jgi:hypothetical protein